MRGWNRPRWRAFWEEDRGVTAAEYGLIGTLTLVVAMGAIDRYGQSLNDNIYDIIDAINARL